MNKTTVLLIDDTDMLRDTTAELLDLAGYNVLTAENGKKGLEIISKQKPELILCDIMMPELDGYGVLRAIHNMPDMADVPFIFITAKSELQDLRQGMNLGADDYLIKPFDNNELLDVINSRLNKTEKIKDKISRKAGYASSLINDKTSFSDIIASMQHKTQKNIQPKQTIYLEGDSINHVYFINKGKVKTYKMNDEGKEFIIELYKEGDIFGHISLMGELERESAMAIEHADIVSIPKQEFLQLILSNNDIAIRLYKSSTDYILEAANKMLKLAYDSSRKKVADALLLYSSKYNEQKTGSFPIVRGDISAIAGISKESVSRILTDLKDEGIIDINSTNGDIKIKNSAILEKLRN